MTKQEFDSTMHMAHLLDSANESAAAGKRWLSQQGRQKVSDLKAVAKLYNQQQEIVYIEEATHLQNTKGIEFYG